MLLCVQLFRKHNEKIPLNCPLDKAAFPSLRTPLQSPPPLLWLICNLSFPNSLSDLVVPSSSLLLLSVPLITPNQFLSLLSHFPPKLPAPVLFFLWTLSHEATYANLFFCLV